MYLVNIILDASSFCQCIFVNLSKLSRAPIVAKCDRKRVLSSWARYCGNMAPAELQVEFSSVRHLTPREFVEKLSRELRVRGVVSGKLLMKFACIFFIQFSLTQSRFLIFY